MADGLQMGLEAPAPVAAESRLFLLERPLEAGAEIGTLGRILHCSAVCLRIATMTSISYAAGDIPAAAGMFAYQSSTSPADLFINTGVDLNIRQWLQWRKIFADLSTIPGAQSATVLSSVTWETAGPLQVKSTQTGFILVESNVDLASDKSFIDRHGQVITIEDPAQTILNLKLWIEDAPHTTIWRLSLQDILDGKTIPSDIVTEWSDEVERFQKSRGWKDRFITKENERATRITADLEIHDGAIHIGTVFLGVSGVRKFLGQGILGIISNKVGSLFGRPSGRIPLKKKNYCESPLFK